MKGIIENMRAARAAGASDRAVAISAKILLGAEVEGFEVKKQWSRAMYLLRAYKILGMDASHSICASEKALKEDLKFYKVFMK